MDTAKLAVCSWSLQPTSVADLVAKVQATGVARVQLHLNPVIDEVAGWEDTAGALAAAGIAVVSGMMTTEGENYSTLETIKVTGGIVPDEHWETNWAMAQGALKVALAMKLRRVSFHAGFIPHDASDPNFEKLVGRIQQMADVFGEHGIELMLETGQETATDLLSFLEVAKCPNLTVNFDPANMILYDKGEPLEALAALMRHVSQVHLKDAVRTKVAGEWGAEVPVGEGEVDWKGFFSLLEDGEFEGDCVIEREAGEDRIGDIQKAVEVVKGI